MNILAIGGGNKRPAMEVALDTLGAEHTTALLIPTAASTEIAYNKKVAMARDFFGELGIRTATLHEFGEAPTKARLDHEFGHAALAYTIGGNTPYMLRTMREHGIDIALGNALKDGLVHAGTSAGALLPFTQIHSNVSARPAKEEWDFELLDGLGLLNGVATAHANKHDPTPAGLRPDSRMEHLVDHFPQASDIGLAIENGAAVFFNGGYSQVIKAVETANVYMLARNGNTVQQTPITDGNQLDVFVKR